MKAFWGSGGIAPPILDLGTRWSEWSASHLGRFSTEERVPATQCIGGLVGPSLSGCGGILLPFASRFSFTSASVISRYCCYETLSNHSVI
jgi:hypothetical protein